MSRKITSLRFKMTVNSYITITPGRKWAYSLRVLLQASLKQNLGIAFPKIYYIIISSFSKIIKILQSKKGVECQMKIVCQNYDS